LDGIITVVDAKNVLQYLNEDKETNEAQQQIAISDCILINKVDLVDENHLNNLENRIKQLNDVAICHRTCRSSIDLDLILNIHAYDQSKALTIDDELNRLVKNMKKIDSTCNENHEHSDSCSSGRSKHLNDVKTICLEETIPMDNEKLLQWLAGMLWEQQSKVDILRMKGVLSIKNEDFKYALQGVHDIFDLSKTDVQWKDNEQRLSKVVFIGKNLNTEALKSGFSQCCWNSN